MARCQQFEPTLFREYRNHRERQQCDCADEASVEALVIGVGQQRQRRDGQQSEGVEAQQRGRCGDHAVALPPKLSRHHRRQQSKVDWTEQVLHQFQQGYVFCGFATSPAVAGLVMKEQYSDTSTHAVNA